VVKVIAEREWGNCFLLVEDGMKVYVGGSYIPVRPRVHRAQLERFVNAKCDSTESRYSISARQRLNHDS